MDVVLVLLAALIYTFTLVPDILQVFQSTTQLKKAMPLQADRMQGVNFFLVYAKAPIIIKFFGISATQIMYTACKTYSKQ